MIVARDGTQGLDAEMRNPSFLSDDVAVDVLGDNTNPTVDASAVINLPESVADVEVDGRIGAIGWFITLAPLVGSDGAFDAVMGYDDDAYAIYDNPNAQRTSPQ